MRERDIPATTLIVNENTGQPYDVKNFAHCIWSICHRAADVVSDLKHAEELKQLTFKQLRHTAVTRLAEAVVELAGIAAITGHSRQSLETIMKHYPVKTRALGRQAIRLRAEHEAAGQTHENKE